MKKEALILMQSNMLTVSWEREEGQRMHKAWQREVKSSNYELADMVAEALPAALEAIEEAAGLFEASDDRDRLVLAEMEKVRRFARDAINAATDAMEEIRELIGGNRESKR